MAKSAQKELKKHSPNGVCGLIADYMDFCIDINPIKENFKHDFAPFYEARERQYGLG